MEVVLSRIFLFLEKTFFFRLGLIDVFLVAIADVNYQPYDI